MPILISNIIENKLSAHELYEVFSRKGHQDLATNSGLGRVFSKKPRHFLVTAALNIDDNNQTLQIKNEHRLYLLATAFCNGATEGIKRNINKQSLCLALLCGYSNSLYTKKAFRDLIEIYRGQAKLQNILTILEKRQADLDSKVISKASLHNNTEKLPDTPSLSVQKLSEIDKGEYKASPKEPMVNLQSVDEKETNSVTILAPQGSPENHMALITLLNTVEHKNPVEEEILPQAIDISDSIDSVMAPHTQITQLLNEMSAKTANENTQTLSERKKAQAAFFKEKLKELSLETLEALSAYMAEIQKSQDSKQFHLVRTEQNFLRSILIGERGNTDTWQVMYGAVKDELHVKLQKAYPSKTLPAQVYDAAREAYSQHRGRFFARIGRTNSLKKFTREFQVEEPTIPVTGHK